MRAWKICLQYVHAFMRGRQEDKTAHWIWSEAGLNPDAVEEDGWTKYIKAEWLEMQTGYSGVGVWTQRYVCCTQTYMHYFSREENAHNRHAEKGRIVYEDIVKVSESENSNMIFIVDTDLNQFRFAAPSAEKCKEWIDQILRLLQRGHEKPPLRKSSVRKMIEEDQLVDFKNGTKVDIGGFGAPFSPRYGDESDRSDSYKQQGSADTSLELKDRDGADVSLASMSASGRSKSKRKNSTRKSSRTDSPSRSRSRGSRSSRDSSVYTEKSDRTEKSLAKQYQEFVQQTKKNPHHQGTSVVQQVDLSAMSTDVSQTKSRTRTSTKQLRTKNNKASIAVTIPYTEKSGSIRGPDGQATGDFYTLYMIQIQVSGLRQWEMKQRYNTFRELHEHLRERIELDHGFPPFPPRTMGKHLGDKEFLERRRLLLQKYLQELLQQDKMLQNTQVRSFLGLNKKDHFVPPEQELEYHFLSDPEPVPPSARFSLPCTGARSGKGTKSCNIM